MPKPIPDAYSPEHIFLSPVATKDALRLQVQQVSAGRLGMAAIRATAREHFPTSEQLRRLEAAITQGLLPAIVIRLASEEDVHFSAADPDTVYSPGSDPCSRSHHITKDRITTTYGQSILELTVPGLDYADFGGPYAEAVLRYGRLVPEDPRGRQQRSALDACMSVADWAHYNRPDVIRATLPQSG